MMQLLNRVFASFDAFDSPFQPSIPSRILIFPTDGFVLTQRQFLALGQAAIPEAEDEAVCVITEGIEHGVFPKTLETFKFLLSSYESYRRLQDPALMANALISKNASGGVLFSYEHHAVVGGSTLFIERFRAAYPDADRELDAFVDAWKRQADQYDISWLPALVQHVGR